MRNFKPILSVAIFFSLFFTLLLWGWRAENARCSAQPKYLGSESCKECHAAEYDSFKKFNKKAHSFQSITRLKKGLDEAELKKCFECHTTGYGKEGGFRSSRKHPSSKTPAVRFVTGRAVSMLRRAIPKTSKESLLRRTASPAIMRSA